VGADASPGSVDHQVDIPHVPGAEVVPREQAIVDDVALELGELDFALEAGQTLRRVVLRETLPFGKGLISRRLLLGAMGMHLPFELAREVEVHCRLVRSRRRSGPRPAARAPRASRSAASRQRGATSGG